MSTKKIEENVGRKSLVMCINKGKTGNSLFLFWEGGKMFFLLGIGNIGLVNRIFCSAFCSFCISDGKGLGERVAVRQVVPSFSQGNTQ